MCLYNLSNFILLYCISFLCIVVRKYLRIIKVKMFNLAQTSRGFSPWLAGSIALRPIVRQKHHGKGGGGEKLLTSWWPGNKTVREEVLRGFWVMTATTYIQVGLLPHMPGFPETPRYMLYWFPRDFSIQSSGKSRLTITSYCFYNVLIPKL